MRRRTVENLRGTRLRLSQQSWCAGKRDQQNNGSRLEKVAQARASSGAEPWQSALAGHVPCKEGLDVSLIASGGEANPFVTKALPISNESVGSQSRLQTSPIRSNNLVSIYSPKEFPNSRTIVTQLQQNSDLVELFSGEARTTDSKCQLSVEHSRGLIKRRAGGPAEKN